MPISVPDLFSATAAVCFGVVLPWAQRVDAGSPPLLRKMAVWGLPFLVLAASWERGPTAALLAMPAMVYAIWLFAYGAGRFLANAGESPAVSWLEALSSSGPLVAATAWVWSRYNSQFAGFPEPLATLTVVHFSITFGVLPAALVAWTRAMPEHSSRRAQHGSLWIYTLSAPLTALCFALRTEVMRPGAVEAVCAVAFAGGFFVWWAGIGSTRARWAGLPLVMGFGLGAGYTVTQHLGWPYLSIPQMFGLHGALNLFGSVALMAWAPVRAVLPGAPAPEARFPVVMGEAESALFVDKHRRDLGPWSEAAFGRMKEALLGYRFYPAKTMVRRTQFEEEGRAVRVGDRIGMGLLLPNLSGLPAICLPAVVEVHEVFDGAEAVRLGYRTTTFHYGRGQWLAEVSRQEDRLVLEVRAHVRPSRWFVWLGLPVYRRFQLGAFRAGCANLQALI